MTLVRDAPEATDLGPSEVPVNPEALFREARRRRHRRWALAAAIAVVTSTVVAVGFDVGGWGPASRHTTAHNLGGASFGDGPPPRAISDRPGSRYNTAVVSDEGVTRPSSNGLTARWAVNGSGIVLSADGGHRWRNITPAAVKTVDPVDAPSRLGSLVGIGTKDLWLPVHEVIGLVPPGEGTGASTSGVGVERSTDGGRTWSLSVLPGCIQACGDDVDLSFITPSVGFALTELTSPPATGLIDNADLHLFSTADGGASWTSVSDPQFNGQGASITFLTRQRGWALTKPSWRHSPSTGRTVEDPGGALYETSDGGLSWHQVQALPVDERYQLPTFLDGRMGVLLGLDAVPGARGESTVFVTANGGQTWTPHPGPRNPALLGYVRGATASLPGPPFSAVSPRQWFVFMGPAMYTTVDAGRHWGRIATDPYWSAGAMQSLHFESGSHGWAAAYVPDCRPMAGTGTCTPIGASLLMTTSNGGRSWRPLPYWRASAAYSPGPSVCGLVHWPRAYPGC